MNARCIVLTSDPGNWLLPGFLHQWDKYSPFPITIYGFTDPGHALTRGRFVSIGKAQEYPKERWSNGLRSALQMAGAEQVVLLLEDYWLTRQVNAPALICADHLMRAWPDVARFDLTSDRMYAGITMPGILQPGSRSDLLSCDAVDIFESFASDYCFSYQASMWSTRHLLALTVDDETPWESELNGCNRLVDRIDLRVLSTYQWPLRYLIAVNKGGFDRDGRWQVPARTLSMPDWAELDALGYTEHPQGVA